MQTRFRNQWLIQCGIKLGLTEHDGSTAAGKSGIFEGSSFNEELKKLCACDIPTQKGNSLVMFVVRTN